MSYNSAIHFSGNSYSPIRVPAKKLEEGNGNRALIVVINFRCAHPPHSRQLSDARILGGERKQPLLLLLLLAVGLKQTNAPRRIRKLSGIVPNRLLSPLLLNIPTTFLAREDYHRVVLSLFYRSGR